MCYLTIGHKEPWFLSFFQDQITQCVSAWKERDWRQFSNSRCTNACESRSWVIATTAFRGCLMQIPCMRTTVSRWDWAWSEPSKSLTKTVMRMWTWELGSTPELFSAGLLAGRDSSLTSGQMMLLSQTGHESVGSKLENYFNGTVYFSFIIDCMEWFYLLLLEWNQLEDQEKFTSVRRHTSFWKKIIT